MVTRRDPGPDLTSAAATERGPRHSNTGPHAPDELEGLSAIEPEINAMEHAIRMAPAGWTFEDEPEAI